MENFDYLKIELKDIVSATGNFDRDKVIGGGGFGLVYKGALSLPEGLTTAAFKRLDPQWGQGNTEFRKEIMMLSEYRHENLISLMYFCDEGDEMILVYEYASRGSLDNYLSDESLTWTKRLNICIGIARALGYLHDPMGTQKRVLHRDIKSSNVLLDDNWTVKVSDFGLSRIGPANQQQSYLISRAVGTPGYCDPMYWQMGFLTKESDVYSFGVVLFEVMCGKLCVQYAEDKPDEPNLIVHEWLKCYEEDRLDEIVFHPLKEQMEPGSLSTFSRIAYECLKIERKDRPSMAKIVQRLEFALEQQEYEGGGGADATITTTTGKGQVEVAGEAKGKLVHFGGTRGFTDDDLLYATAEMMGKGTYGGVYKATLEYGDQIAVKRLKEMITKNQREFEIEVNLLGKIRHSNLLTMRAYYLGPKEEKLLIFDFMPNGNLTTFLHARGPETPVDWPTRMRIAKAMARGLLSLHTHHNMIHGNLTSRNVLLDENINPKIADFGLSRLMTAKTNSIRSATPGALPYQAPELLTLKKANTKTDIYSLGVIMLELLTGKSPGEAINGVALPQWVASIVKEEWTNEVFDLDLLKDASENGDELLNTLKLALICVDPSPSARPEAQLVFQQLKEIRPETTTSSGDDGGVGPSTSE